MLTHAVYPQPHTDEQLESGMETWTLPVGSNYVSPSPQPQSDADVEEGILTPAGTDPEVKTDFDWKAPTDDAGDGW